eukprot:2361647-Pleurochrysis_carterae.AAC.1
MNAAEASLVRRKQRGRSEPSSSDLLKPKRAELVDVAWVDAAGASLARRNESGRSEPNSLGLARPKRA